MVLFDREKLDGGEKSLNRFVFDSRCRAGSPITEVVPCANEFTKSKLVRFGQCRMRSDAVTRGLLSQLL